MFEFLKECNNLNIYSRAHDCEIKLNTFDCVTPMAVFFESVFKVLNDEIFPNKSHKGINLYDLLSNVDFTEAIKTRFGFDDFSTVH